MIYGDEENERFYDEHYFRKQELRELKLLQKQEQKQFQDLAFKNQVGGPFSTLILKVTFSPLGLSHSPAKNSFEDRWSRLRSD